MKRDLTKTWINIWGKTGYRFPYNVLEYIKRFPRNIKWSYQRIVRGWCDADTWELHSYIEYILADMLFYLSNNFMGTGLKENGEAYTVEEWRNLLQSLANRIIENDIDWSPEEDLDEIGTEEYCKLITEHDKIVTENKKGIFDDLCNHWWNLWD